MIIENRPDDYWKSAFENEFFSCQGISWILVSKMDVKINLWIKTKNLAADSKIAPLKIDFRADWTHKSNPTALELRPSLNEKKTLDAAFWNYLVKQSFLVKQQVSIDYLLIGLILSLETWRWSSFSTLNILRKIESFSAEKKMVRKKFQICEKQVSQKKLHFNTLDT